MLALFRLQAKLALQLACRLGCRLILEAIRACYESIKKAQRKQHPSEKENSEALGALAHFEALGATLQCDERNLRVYFPERNQIHLCVCVCVCVFVCVCKD